MNPIIAVIAVIIVGILLSTGPAKKASPPKIQAKKISVSQTPTISQAPSPTEGTVNNSPVIIPSTFAPTNQLMPTQPATNNTNSQSNSNDWQYPGSSGGGGNYSTSDNSNTVTNWYKQKIQNNGMNTTSFVTNSVNGNINNQLVGSNGSSQVRVFISKAASDSQTKISVSF